LILLEVEEWKPFYSKIANCYKNIGMGLAEYRSKNTLDLLLHNTAQVRGVPYIRYLSTVYGVMVDMGLLVREYIRKCRHLDSPSQIRLSSTRKNEKT